MSRYEMDEKFLKKFEKDWEDRIEKDARYWRENDAKLRAIKSVGSYEEFSDIVKAAHLQPLQRKEILDMQKKNQSCWNYTSNLNPDKHTTIFQHSEKPLQMSNQNLGPALSVPRTPAELVHLWGKLESEGKLSLIKQTPLTTLAQLLQVEAPPGMLGDLASLLKPSTDKAEMAWQAQLLQTLTTSARFSLNLQFLSSAEKMSYQLLFDNMKTAEELEETVGFIYKEFNLK